MSSKRKKGFKCSYCFQWVGTHKRIGTAHRNHCPFCLWSKHVDLKKPGDRQSGCQAKMKPIGLTFKQEGKDKYGKMRQGELMIIHNCTGCGKISINRIAADDAPKAILGVLKQSETLEDNLRNQLKKDGIKLLEEDDRNEVRTQLFGKNN